MFDSLRVHVRFILALASLLSAISLFLMYFFPDKAIFLWCFGAAMIFGALIAAVFLHADHS